MTAGPGKYDDLCTYVRNQVGLVDDGNNIGGVAIIVLGGNKGNGFAVQADMLTTAMMPDLLEQMAKQMRDDLTGEGNAQTNQHDN